MSPSRCRALRPRRCATDCRCMSISAQRIWSAAPRCWARATSPQASAASFSSNWSARSPRCGATGCCCATTAPGTPSAAAGSSTRFRRAAAEAALDAALADLVAAGRVVREGAVLRLAAHEPRLSREDEKLWRQLLPLLGTDDLRPPRVRELAEALGLQPEAATRFLKRMERFGRVAAVAPNRYFLPETVARLSAVARELVEASPD